MSGLGMLSLDDPTGAAGVAAGIVADRAGDDAARAWADLERGGFTLVSVPERAGGSGGDTATAAAIVEAVAAEAIAVPLADTCLLGGWALAAADIAVPDGPLAVALAGPGEAVHLPDVPYARAGCPLVVVSAVDGGARVALYQPGPGHVCAGSNLAGEPRGSVTIDASVRPVAVGPAAFAAGDLERRGAIARSVQILGAARQAVERSSRYAGERVQFGRPIARFQAVQQHLAEMVGEVVVLRSAVRAAINALADGDTASGFVAGAVKIQAGRTASRVARLAHQVHGALGFTDEHELHRSTTRLWAWRDEYGSEFEWAARLSAVAARTDEPLWHIVTNA
jgi:acyl-CoA dehydrogenase